MPIERRASRSAHSESAETSAPSTKTRPDDGLLQAVDEADQRRLAGARAADHADDRARRHLEVDTVERRHRRAPAAGGKNLRDRLEAHERSGGRRRGGKAARELEGCVHGDMHRVGSPGRAGGWFGRRERRAGQDGRAAQRRRIIAERHRKRRHVLIAVSPRAHEDASWRFSIWSRGASCSLKSPRPGDSVRTPDRSHRPRRSSRNLYGIKNAPT